MPSQVADTLAKLLDGYLAAALPRPEDGSHAVAEMQAAAAADIAVELCMALDMQPLLWSSVFPRFAAAGCRQVLLEHLLPHIFRDQLTTLAPEVMQVCPPTAGAPAGIVPGRCSSCQHRFGCVHLVLEIRS